jgi:hypothetical protein
MVVNKGRTNIAANCANDKQHGGEGEDCLAHLEHGSRLG